MSLLCIVQPESTGPRMGSVLVGSLNFWVSIGLVRFSSVSRGFKHAMETEPTSSVHFSNWTELSTLKRAGSVLVLGFPVLCSPSTLTEIGKNLHGMTCQLHSVGFKDFLNTMWVLHFAGSGQFFTLVNHRKDPTFRLSHVYVNVK